MVMAKIIEAQEMTVTYADGSTMVNSLENKVVERDGETYTLFNTRGGPCFHYQVGQNHVTAIEFK